jgi:beta-glucanase (GH16 family)
MKQMIFISSIISLAVALCGCGGSDDPDTVPSVNISVQPESVAFPAEGGNRQIEVNTTGKEWGAYANADWIKVETQNSTSQKGYISIKVDANPFTKKREAAVSVMSGTARKNIIVAQDAALDNAYNAPDGYSLVWNDEFNSGSELNPNDWTHEVKNAGWVNNELQNYVNHLSPGGNPVTEVKNGHLQIHCFKENGKIYSGRVYAKVKDGWKYGYMEASIKLPKGKGTWPAFWMMPVNFKSWPADGEIDIMEEVGYHPDYVSSSLHATAHVHSNNTQVTHEMYCQGAEGDFHTYAILWTANNITTYVDGKVQLTYDNRGLGRNDWPYDDPFYIIFNLAWGGSWGGAQGVDEGALPVTMEVDYVRVFQKK